MKFLMVGLCLLFSIFSAQGKEPITGWERIKYPELALRSMVSGKVVISGTVHDGVLSDVTVFHSDNLLLSRSVEKEIKRLKLSPAFEDTIVSISFVFRFSENHNEKSHIDRNLRHLTIFIVGIPPTTRP